MSARKVLNLEEMTPRHPVQYILREHGSTKLILLGAGPVNDGGIGHMTIGLESLVGGDNVVDL